MEKEIEQEKPQGTLNVCVRSAVLIRDMNFVTKMSPYVMVTIGSESKKTHVHRHGGQTPKWGTVLEFDITEKQNIILIQVLSKHSFSKDDIIGSADLGIEEVFQTGKMQDFYEIKYKNQYLSGNVGLVITYLSNEAKESLRKTQNEMVLQQAQMIFYNNSLRNPAINPQAEGNKNAQDMQLGSNNLYPNISMSDQNQRLFKFRKYPNGGEYRGEMVNDLREGQGKMIFKDQSTYEGQWAQDMPSGYGIFIDKEGDAYQGNFEKGLKHGNFIVIRRDGRQRQEVWIYDKIQK